MNPKTGCTFCYRHEEKPPIGIMPRRIWPAQRKAELGEAILRYIGAGIAVSSEWLTEYNDLVKELA